MMNSSSKTFDLILQWCMDLEFFEELNDFEKHQECSDVLYPPSKVQTQHPCIIARTFLICLKNGVDVICKAAKLEELGFVRKTFDGFPDIVKALQDLRDMQNMPIGQLDDYMQFIIECLQEFAALSEWNSSANKTVDRLKSKTIELVSEYYKTLDPPLISQAYTEFKKRREARLARESSPCPPVADESQSTQQPDTSTTNITDSTLSETSLSSPAACRSPLNNLRDDDQQGPPIEVSSMPSPRLLSNGKCNFDKFSTSESNGDSDVETSREKTKEPIIRRVETDSVDDGSADTYSFASGQTERRAPSSPILINYELRRQSLSRTGYQPPIKDPTTKSRRKPFSILTDVKLIHGVGLHGVGSWNDIRKAYDFPAYRTAMQLKDRWRTLLHKGIVRYDNENKRLLTEPHFSACKEFAAKRAARRSQAPELILPRLQRKSSFFQKKTSTPKTSDCDIPDNRRQKSKVSPRRSSAPKKDSFPSWFQRTEVSANIDISSDESQDADRLGDNGIVRSGDAAAAKSDSHANEQVVDGVTCTRDDQSRTNATGSRSDTRTANVAAAYSCSRELHVSDRTIDSDVVIVTDDSLTDVELIDAVAEGATRRAAETSHASATPSGDDAMESARDLPRTSASSAESSPHRKGKFSTTKRKRRLWDVEGEQLRWNDPFPDAKVVSREKAASVFDTIFVQPQRSHKKVPWQDWEVKNLKAGVAKFGEGNWAMILDNYKFKSRTSIMLKDKYRNMQKSSDI